MIRDWITFTEGPLPVEARAELLGAVWDAQRESAYRNRENASNVAAVHSAIASFSMTAALASAVLSTGGLHAPVLQARVLLFRQPVPRELPEGRIPGFGNSFFRDRIDPSWDKVVGILSKSYLAIWNMIQNWSDLLKASGRILFPNAAAFTAAVAELVHWPVGQELIMVIQPRITVWAALAASELDLWRTKTWEH